MKLKSNRMKPVIRLAEKQEEQSARVYAQCLANVRELEEQLEKLYSYRLGYNQQMIDSSKKGMGSHRLQDTLMFMSNLNQSIEGILSQIERQKKVCDEKKQLWMAMHSKTKIYSKVTKKYIAEEQIVMNKNEQKLVDEFNQSSFNRKLNSKHKP